MITSLQSTICASKLLRRTIAVAGMRRLIMLKAVLRAIVRAYAPGARMLAAMPPSAVRQVLFAI